MYNRLVALNRSFANHKLTSFDVDNVSEFRLETAVGLVIMTLAAHGRLLLSVVNGHPAEGLAQLLARRNVLIGKLVEERLELVFRR